MVDQNLSGKRWSYESNNKSKTVKEIKEKKSEWKKSKTKITKDEVGEEGKREKDTVIKKKLKEENWTKDSKRSSRKGI